MVRFNLSAETQSEGSVLKVKKYELKIRDHLSIHALPHVCDIKTSINTETSWCLLICTAAAPVNHHCVFLVSCSHCSFLNEKQPTKQLFYQIK